MTVASPTSDHSDTEYYAQFSWPEDTDDERYFRGENDDWFVEQHLDGKQLIFLADLEANNAQRSTRAKKKIKGKRQIKSKHARSVKYKTHNQQLYIHHRVFKRVVLDPPRCNYLSEPKPVPVYSTEGLHRVETPKPPPPPKFTLTEQTIPTEPSFDDAMVRFLLEIQNRDLSPEDYEVLLRLDERVQRKTVNKSVFDSLLTVNVNESHLNDQCAICMEEYLLGQSLKRLPCSHLFHDNCIETYLKNFSTQCPLDNLPLA